MAQQQQQQQQPPLVPPGDQLAAALLMQATAAQAAQAQLAAQKQSGLTPFEQQILKNLGIDPEAVKQAGLHQTALDKQLGLFPGLSASPALLSPHQEQNLFSRNPPQFVDQNKRARTRITDDQLKILRANFDINNSPSDDQINLLVAQTGLPPKVIKHWYRNTLFKERQRNKDSPYNFNNPPSTVLNIEEYEKTGEQPKITDQQQEKNEIVSKNKDLIKLEDKDTNEDREERKHSHKSDIGRPEEGRASEGQIPNNLLSESETQSKFEELRRLQMSLGLNVSTGS